MTCIMAKMVNSVIYRLLLSMREEVNNILTDEVIGDSEKIKATSGAKFQE